MTAFTLDTSGYVTVPHQFASGAVSARDFYWFDLSPFAQGYVTRLFESFRRGDIGHWPEADAKRVLRFDRLHHEALAAILKDCAAMVDPPHVFRNDEDAGARCWRARRESWSLYSGGPSLRAQFPPLTPFLDDEGKVRLREAG